MNPLSEYEKMPQSFQKMGVDALVWKDWNKLTWVVTEKVHGANFSFVYEDKTLRFAKRKEYLQWTDDFFGFQLLVHQIENQVFMLFEELSRLIPAHKYIIYGELFGGEYPHPDVPANVHLQAIQTGVYYTPDIHFYAFDIAIEEENKEKYYLDYETAANYFQKHQILYAKALLTGKMNEVLGFDTRINSAIPKILGLPAIENNLIEGIVIKPLRHLSVLGKKERPIIKLKNKEFEENIHYHQAEKWSYLPHISSKSEELNFLWVDIQPYINENRLNSVLSKIGAVNRQNEKRMKAIYEEFLRDVWTDFNENNQQILTDLSEEQQAWLQERISQAIITFIHKYE